MDRAPHHRDFFTLFLSQVARRPSARAVQWQDGTWTYAALRERMEAYALVLMAHGIGAGSRVAISLNRSPDMIAIVLAVLRLRAAYVPLDPDSGEEQFNLKLRQFKPALIVTERAGLNAKDIEEIPTVTLDQLQEIPDEKPLPVFAPASSDPICIISTVAFDGTVKKFVLNRETLNHSIQWQLADSRVGPGERTLQFMPLTSEIAFQEIFATLCAGGALVLMGDGRFDPSSLVTFLKDQKVHRLFLPLVYLEVVANTALENHILPATLREVITGEQQSQASNRVKAFFAALPFCTAVGSLNQQFTSDPAFISP